MSRLRWTIAHHLNKLPWTCWTRLVSWALDGGRQDVRQDSLCRRDAAECGRCYCGKVAAE